MILLLATRYRLYIGWLLFLTADLAFTLSAEATEAGCRVLYPTAAHYTSGSASSVTSKPVTASPAFPAAAPAAFQAASSPSLRSRSARSNRLPGRVSAPAWAHVDIGGPNQPEMGSFKSVNMSNMVNLFTGNFNYNIPLLDVGGYPVNLYYDGEVGPEQDASWVGLGWNINPGSISRNMRGIPDDFDGSDTLVQTTNLKPNITYGVSLSSDIELTGVKVAPSIGMNWGASWNNYLGLALDFGVKGGLNFKVADKVESEKNGPSLGASIGADISSRNGLTLSPNVSLSTSLFIDDRTWSLGTGISTSYNSREGLKALQIAEQVSANQHNADDDSHTTYNGDVHSNAINFARPSYLPTMRVPMVHSNYSGRFQLGGALWGIYGSAEIEAYEQKSTIDPSKYIQHKSMVGYLYYENAVSNPNAVTDFTRFNDREVTPNTPIISAPQYTYDVYTIQGEGTGGSIRPYRGDLGYVRDNFTASQDNSIGAGVDVGIPGHVGLNVDLINTPTTVTEWTLGNALHTAIPFTAPTPSGSWENVCFRNPGEPAVLDENAYTRIGGTDLVRFELSGDPHNPKITTMLDRFSKSGNLTSTVNPTGSGAYTRQKRGQVIDFFSAHDAALVGLDKMIRNYNYQTLLASAADTLLYTAMSRDSGYRKGHHISQINVTESNGKRYIYGLPVYNITQQDYTFTTDSSTLSMPDLTDTVKYGTSETNPASATKNSRDGYVQITQTPAYAHSFLLTGLLSPDYVDVTGDGITDDDLGQAVKFNYSEIVDQSGNPVLHQWRTPAGANIANFNPGTRSQFKDDKGLISYGKRESWYLHSIETKTMIAVFTLENRSDGKGVNDGNGGINTSDSSSKALKQIDLYSKSDLRQNGLTGAHPAHPIKTVHFCYSYKLCPGTRDNINLGGKLTLDSVWFTFNGQTRLNKDKYAFSYTDTATFIDPTTKKAVVDTFGNPAYTSYASDRWGTYKPQAMNPGSVKNSDFPYTPQNQLISQGESPQVSSPKAALDTNAAAWSLKRILLPSGGQLEIGYETDDYAYVQNLRAMDMLSIAGFGSSPVAYSNRLYDLGWNGTVENNYLFVNVPSSCANTGDVLRQYLQGDSMIDVRLDVNMPAGTERLNSYAKFDTYGVYSSNIIWIHLINVNNVSPLSLTAIEYLREQLPAEAYPGYDNSRGGTLEQVADALVGVLDNLEEAFGNPVNYLRSQGMAQTAVTGQCFARLNDPDGFKYGGGQRVKFVKLSDNWQKMAGEYNSIYTQTYDYTTTETFNDTIRKISSGVAAYEPGIGGDENPFQNIAQVQDKLPLGPTSYGAIEMPILEPFFPAPTVGYSQVTVRSCSSIPHTKQQKSRSGIGRQVTQYYTAKDFPVYYSNTWLDPGTDLEAHDASTTNFFHKYAFDSRALSQGFLVATNDMHGKMRSQTSYADNDTTLKVNYTENFYRNTGVNGLNETFPFVSAAQGGTIDNGNVGIDIELMTDTREFTVQSSGEDVQAQEDLFPIYLPFWLPFIWPVSSTSNNNYRAVTTTKVIGYHAVLDSVVVYDKGSMVSTKNLLYDAETGDVIVTRTNNEFNQPIYSTSFPAWWAYDGMGPAYQNIGVRYNNSTTPLNFTNGQLVGDTTFDATQFVSGDEVMITSNDLGQPCGGPAEYVKRLWVLDLNKNNSPFPVITPNFFFIDSAGNPYNNTNVTGFRIIRSGRRNMLDQKAATITSMNSPIVTRNGVPTLTIDSTGNVLTATATEFGEKWQTDQDDLRRLTKTFDPATCTTTQVAGCTGTLETINPYVKGLFGNFRPSRTLVCYGSRVDSNPSLPTNISKNGYIANFSPYWTFGSNGLVPNTTSPLWVESVRTTRVNAQGLELETKNALGIYTSAEYGYNKTLPTAVVNNASYYQMDYEGFEDSSYASYLDSHVNTYCPQFAHLDLYSMTHGHVLNSDKMGFPAHTGKYMLGVDANATAKQLFPVVSDPANYAFHINYYPDTAKHLNVGGGNVTSLGVTPGYSSFPDPQTYVTTQTIFSGGGLSATLSVANTSTSTGINTKDVTHNFGLYYVYYIEVTTPGDYVFSYNMTGAGYALPTNDNSNIHLTITDLKGNTIASPGYANTGNIGGSTTVHMCGGIYQILATASNSFEDDGVPSSATFSTAYTISLTTNAASTDYQSLSTLNGCIATTPSPGTDSMMHSKFSIPEGQRMVISAWVHEDSCGIANTGGVCNQTNYTHSRIIVNAGGSDSTLYPAGPVLDGWQRIEGFITAPMKDTTGYIIFSNTSGNTIYFDDIRIHPFNAEMKSYIYDPVSLRLSAELDDNNYATFYEYDEEGTLVRTKAETQRGIQTIKETRSAKQKNIISIQ